MSAAVPAGPAPGGPTTLLVIAKEPLPGRVKTRLTPPYAPAEAALLAEAALTDTLRAVRAMPACRRILVLDGRPGPWLPPGFEVLPQCAGGLDERLAAAFAACTGPALLVGMDTPQLTPGLLAPALGPAGWQGCDAWFGPAADGGFWALGLAEPWQPGLLRGVPMSTATTGAVQRRRLVAAGLRVRDLPELLDVDTAADALRVAEAAPGSRFAAAVERLGRRVPAPRDPVREPVRELSREPSWKPADVPLSPGGGGRPCRRAN
ncbi:TIGR04282 family arsenosugar biosynthesis glycosyltransferase [Streptomyces klenkii]